MKTISGAALCAVAFGLAGCVTTETVSYNPSSTQQPIIRDGVGALVSSQPKSVVMLRPAGRGVAAGQRPIYVVAVQNLSKQPVSLRVADIQVVQTKQGRYARALPVKTYEQLVKEEKTRQVVTAILVGAGAAANSYSASQAGHGSVTTHTPRGTYHSTYYSPAAQQIALANASAQNAQNINQFADQAQANMAALEADVLKDNTVMPGEWIGGTVTFETPSKEHADGKSKSYSIAVKVGDETHVIEAVQAPPAKG
jgi:hypothetical protein